VRAKLDPMKPKPPVITMFFELYESKTILSGDWFPIAFFTLIGGEFFRRMVIVLLDAIVLGSF
jgi:hypothetical protein